LNSGKIAKTIGEVLATHWQSAGLITPSMVKPVITTIDGTPALRRLRRLGALEQQTLRAAIGAIVG